MFAFDMVINQCNNTLDNTEKVNIKKQGLIFMILIIIKVLSKCFIVYFNWAWESVTNCLNLIG